MTDEVYGSTALERIDDDIVELGYALCVIDFIQGLTSGNNAGSIGDN
ncbi:hypothetical protein [Porticoccus sp.]